MYILDEVLDKRKLAVLFSIFALFATVGMGAMVQVNSISDLLNNSIGISKEVVGIFIAIVATYIIFGGKYRIAKINSWLIPLCTGIYVVLCGGVLVMYSDNILQAIKDIVASALGIRQVVGAVVGVSVIKCISVGFSRGMFSNEAGMGSAPIFAVTTEDEGDIKTNAHIMAYSVFIDTIFLCTLTGLVLVASDAYTIPNVTLMLQAAFESIPLGNVLLTFCMIIFVVSTIPCWEFYGEQALNYLLNKRYVIYLYKLIYIFFVYLGCIMSINIVWDLSNISNALMALPNLYMIFKLRNTIER